MEKGKNKYSEARRRANKKYDAKTYRVFQLWLRKEEDEEIINEIDAAKENNVPLREWLNKIFYKK